MPWKATTVNLTDKGGHPIPAKMKIQLANSKSEVDSNAKLFLEQVDANVSRLSSNDTMMNTASTIWTALKFAKSLMDKLSSVCCIDHLSAKFILN